MLWDRFGRKPVAAPKRKRRNTARVDFDYLKPSEVDQLLQSASESARDLAILSVFAYLGLRCNELRMLNVDDIDWEDRTVRVLHAKGGKQRLLPADLVLGELGAWLEVRPASSDRHGEALFPTTTSPRVSNRYLRTLVKRYGAAAGVGRRIPQGLHPHALRHTVATTLLARKVDLRVVQEVLGHSSPSTTALYAAVDVDLKRDAITRLRGDL